MFRMKEPGSDKWIAPKRSSGFSSSKSDARAFDTYIEAVKLLNADSRYRGLKFACMLLEYDQKES